MHKIDLRFDFYFSICVHKKKRYTHTINDNTYIHKWKKTHKNRTKGQTLILFIHKDSTITTIVLKVNLYFIQSQKSKSVSKRN